MDRICPILTYQIDELNGKTAHALIGDCNLTTITSVGARGTLVGQSVLSKLIDLPSTVKALGIFMSWMHYGMKYDGNDLEFVIGKKCNNDRIKIFVIDFGMVEKIESYTNTDPLESSLNSVPYFPLNFNCKENMDDLVKYSFQHLIDIFRKRYVEESGRYKEIAEQIYESSL